MVADVELGEGADVAHPHHLHREVAEEVDDVEGAGGQGEDEDEGREDGAQQLLQDEDLQVMACQGVAGVVGPAAQPALAALTALYWKSWAISLRVSDRLALPCQWSGM